MTSESRITVKQLGELRHALRPLLEVQFTSLMLPKLALADIEPSQVGTIVGTLMDAMIPHLDNVADVGLTKHEGTLGDREGYPDYRHDDLALRVELKLIFVDNQDIVMKKPPTPREPSARLTQKVTVKNVVPRTDAMLVIAYQLQEATSQPDAVTPTIIDFEVFSMIELVEARDQRLAESGGLWFGNYETPCIPSRLGAQKSKKGLPLDASTYGRKADEGKDYNEDTNFGKLKRIPHAELQAFLQKHADAEHEG